MASSARALPAAAVAPRRAPVARRGASIVVAAAVATKTVKIGTRGSPLALAQAYMTRDLLKVRLSMKECEERRRESRKENGLESKKARASSPLFVKPSPLSSLEPSPLSLSFSLSWF